MMRAQVVSPTDAGATNARIGERYQVESVLGRGGMATVYRVLDTNTGRHVALKRLMLQTSAQRHRDLVALFEREFHVLAGLSHPRVIAVYDCGLDGDQPYYTMELLDGGDLVERSPLAWPDACRVLFDVCSSLALLHSRRLLHRDVSPRNVRCTSEGQAKLIDFGAMIAMGHCKQLVGTPAFTAPEVVHGLALDGRADLYSAGATLYYALTGRAPRVARAFSEVIEACRAPLPAPSALVPGVPSALDSLVLSLLSVEPSQRPRTAHEVMERLAGLAGISRAEPLSVKSSYLAAPALVGRRACTERLRSLVARLRRAQGASVLLQAADGCGRSRMLDVSVLEAKTSGAVVLRSDARAASSVGELTTVQALVDELLDNFGVEAIACIPANSPLAPLVTHVQPRPRVTELGLDRLGLQAALQQWFQAFSERQLLVLAVDDVHTADPASLAWLAALSESAKRMRLLLVLTAEQRALEQGSDALRLLASSCETLRLAPLTPEQTQALLGSVFGDVPNLAMISARVHESSGGNPRDCVDLLRHLSSTGQIHYDRGQWTLPSHLDALDLPRSAEEALLQRLLALGAQARRLLETHAMASHAAFSRDDYRRLEEQQQGTIEAALDELIEQELLETDGERYAISRPGFAKTLVAQVPAGERAARERSLARLYEQKRITLLSVRHWLRAGDVAGPADVDADRARAVECATELNRRTTEVETVLAEAQMSADEAAYVLEQCLAAAPRAQRSAFEIAELRHWLVMLSTNADAEYYHRSAGPWLQQLLRDSGLERWRELSGVEDPGARLTQALVHAHERYQALPEAERVYSPLLAIQYMVHYVAASIALGARGCDGALLARLPALLEPLSPLSPLIHAMWLNAVSTYEVMCLCQFERMRERFREAFERLQPNAQNDVPTRFVCNALALTLGLFETRLGIPSGERWIAHLDTQPDQCNVDAAYLRKIVRLAHGDFEGAEQCRRQAELLALQARARPMLAATLGVELTMHTLANDLTGVEQVQQRIAAMAARYPGWRSYAHLAEGLRQRLCGKLQLAATELERALELARYDPADKTRPMLAWQAAVSAYIDTLTDLGRIQDAQRVGQEALAICQELGTVLASYDISVSLALAEAKAGLLETATARIDAVIEARKALGIEGLLLGATYEARTRVAILAQDQERIAHFGQLTAAEYRHGTSSALAARYQRLMQEAMYSGINLLPSLTDVRSTVCESLGDSDARTKVRH